MRDVLFDVLPWFRAGERFAVATVTRTWSSAPRPIGATMAVSAAGEAVGSVSGGCVEGAVYEAAQEAIADGRPRLVSYGVSDDDAFDVGLTCGAPSSCSSRPSTGTPVPTWRPSPTPSTDGSPWRSPPSSTVPAPSVGT